MIIQVTTNYFDFYSKIEPSELRFIADQMEKDDVNFLEIEFDSGYSNISITKYGYREETSDEKKKREDAEKERAKKEATKLSKEKIELIVKSQKFGIKVSSDPIPSEYNHVYWVVKNTNIEDWTTPSNGYVWYDEAGLLGKKEIYKTSKKANEALGLYVKETLQ